MECGSIDVVPLHKVLQLWISKQYAMVLAVSVTRIPISCPCFSLPVSSLPLPWLLPSQRRAMLHVRLLLFNRGFVRGLLVGCAPSLLFCHLKAHPAFSTKCWSRTEVQSGSACCREGVGWEKDFFLCLFPIWPYAAVSSRRSWRGTTPPFQWDQIIWGIDNNGRR